MTTANNMYRHIFSSRQMNLSSFNNALLTRWPKFFFIDEGRNA